MEGKKWFHDQKETRKEKENFKRSLWKIKSGREKQNSLKQRAWNKLQIQKTDCQGPEWSWVWRWVSVITALGSGGSATRNPRASSALSWVQGQPGLSETVFITSKMTRIILKELRAPLTRFLMARANTVIGARRIVPARDSSVSSQEDF